MLARLLSKYWWVLVLRGLLAILFGIVAYARPGLTLATLVLLFAAYALADGALDLVKAIGARREDEHWWWLLLEGAIGILFGVFTFRNPVAMAAVIALYIAAWAIVTGALRIVMAVRLRKEIEGEFWMGLSGATSVVFGLLMMAQPAAGALTLLWLIAIWSIVLGFSLVLLGFRVRRFKPGQVAAPPAVAPST